MKASLERNDRPGPTHRFWLHVLDKPGWGWALWFSFAIVIVSARFSSSWTQGSLIGDYRDAAFRWIEGQPLFSGTGNVFVYLPHAAILFTPFTLLPFAWAGTMWRIINLGVFAVGVWRFARLAGRDSSRHLFCLV